MNCGVGFSLQRASARQTTFAGENSLNQDHYRGMQFSRRRLPHLHSVGEPLFVTFRLHRSLPPGREFRGGHLDSGTAFVCMDRLLDEYRSGPTYLRLPDIARMLAERIRQGANSDYDLHAWVSMPNHAHLLIAPRVNVPLLMRRLKGASAREANQLLGKTGQPFWQDESYDHLVPNADEFHRIETYILENPVRAGLAPSAEQYPWCIVSKAAG
jgi:putative transposase